MQIEGVEVTDLGGEAPDFSIWGMFWQADIVVQLVIITLLLMSVLSWAVIVHKFLKIRALKKSADDFEEKFWSGNSLEDIMRQIGNGVDNPLAAIFVAAMKEWKKSVSGKKSVMDKMNLQDRIGKVMRVTMNKEMSAIESHTSYLASVGSVAPFIGLFGTVWGIMNSFTAIAVTSNTSLAVVAPGIAEALLATALGLVAAIPAVVFYNRLVNEMTRYSGRLEGFSDEFAAYLSRQLDERG